MNPLKIYNKTFPWPIVGINLYTKVCYCAAGSAVLGARVGGRRPASVVRTGRPADGRVLRCQHLRRRRHRRWPARPGGGRAAALAPCAQLHRPVSGRGGQNLCFCQRTNLRTSCK